MKQETPDILRLRSHIFPGEKQIAYVYESPDKDDFPLPVSAEITLVNGCTHGMK
jgi:hypothetical protein